MLEHAYSRMTIVLVGNKKDLDTEREVSYDEGLEFARKNKLIFFETSAKTAENVDQTFIYATKIIYNNIGRGEYDLANEAIGIKPGNVPTQHALQSDVYSGDARTVIAGDARTFIAGYAGDFDVRYAGDFNVRNAVPP